MQTLATSATHLLAQDDSMPNGRLIRAYFSEAKYECVRTLRTVAFAVPFLIMPIAVYLLFGIVFAKDTLAKSPAVANLLYSGFSVFAVIGPGLFGIGCSLAIEREAGLMKLKRALPAPGGAYILAKMSTALFFAALAVTPLTLVAWFAGHITLSAPQIMSMLATVIIGSVTFSAIGLCIGAYVSGGAAPAVTNLVYLPMMWLSGLFIPLPEFLRPWAVIWPAFHLNQIVLGVGHVATVPLMPPLMSVVVLVGVTVLFGGLAIRRLARTG